MTHEESACHGPSHSAWFLLAIGVAVMAGCSSSSEPDPWSEWTTLRLDASAAALLSGGIEMHLETGAEISRLETRTEARFVGIKLAGSATETVFSSRTGLPESYVDRSKRRGRRYLFEDGRYSIEKLVPVNGADAPLDDWEMESREVFDYPRGEDGRLVEVFDYFGMILHLRDAPLHEPGDEITVHVATSRGPTAYRIEVSEAREGTRTFQDLSTGQPLTLPVRSLRLRVAPVDPDADEGFLRMEGETEIWVEAGSKTLLELSGRVPKVPGRVTLELTAMG